ncbi:hypothetical protein LTR85_011434 [Meristemomyces frigidus]|nr:hypothetical protein LTR85_011434 [Meristemomyces frigidus]
MANMFGVLNRFISRLDSEPQPQQHRSSATGYGFQVLRNTDNTIPLEPWFDFIIGINGHTIDNADPSLFATEVRNSAGSTISLGVFGTKGQQIREIYVSVPSEQKGLGLALQWAALNVTEDVWHILDVMPNSPADVAGLLPYSDYVIGSPDGNLQGDAGLGGLVEQSMEQPLRLYVYNHEYDVTRMVTITPSKNWGGEGALGCVLGYGALHRVPAPLTEPAQAPGETLFESADGHEQQTQYYHPSTEPHQQPHDPRPTSSSPAAFLVPANMHFASPSPPPPITAAGGGGPPPGRAKKARAHHAAAPIAGLDDYFKEGEQKSRELDGSSTPKPSGGLPPPPKAGSGGPPKAASPAPEV